MVNTGPNTTRRKTGPADAGRGIEQAAADISRYFTGGEFNPGATLPSRADLMQRFGLTEYTVRGALKLLQERGVIVTVRRGHSTLTDAKPAHTLSRDGDDPTRHLRPVGPARHTRLRATSVMAELFDIRDRAQLYVHTQPTEHRTNGARVLYVRTIPAEVLFIDPEPDAFGDRAAIVKALTEHYGPLATVERVRFISNPTGDVRRDLEVEPETPVVQFRRLTRAATGRLLMIETEATDATSAEWEFRL